MMKKLSTLYTYIELSVLMVVVLVLLGISYLKDAVTSQLHDKKKVKSTYKKYTHNRLPSIHKKTTRYIIT